MEHRWAAPPEPAPAHSEDDDVQPRGEGALPAEAVESWRTWLLTGRPAVVSDRRRVRGSHSGLKRLLVDGTGTEKPPSWRHFSGAMVRLAVNDALNALPADQTHIVWLAYFGGLSNSEIGKRLGLSVGEVRRRLHRAFDMLSRCVELGRAEGRRATYAVLAWLSLRRFAQTARRAPGHLSETTLANAFVAAGATAAVLVGAVTAGPVARPAVAPIGITRAASPHPLSTIGASSSLASATGTVTSALGTVQHAAVPAQISVPVQVNVPAVPPVVLPLPSPPPLPPTHAA